MHKGLPAHALFDKNIHIRVLDDESVTIIPEMVISRWLPYIEIAVPHSRVNLLDELSSSNYIGISTMRADFERYIGYEDGGPLYIYRLKRLR